MFEAICGAIYLDGGIESVKEFFQKAVGDIILNLKINGYVDDPKTKLQEMLKQAKIVYRTTKSGEDHKPVYHTTVLINDVKMGNGVGNNKKDAECQAASMAINNLSKV